MSTAFSTSVFITLVNDARFLTITSSTRSSVIRQDVDKSGEGVVLGWDAPTILPYRLSSLSVSSRCSLEGEDETEKLQLKVNNMLIINILNLSDMFNGLVYMFLKIIGSGLGFF